MKEKNQTIVDESLPVANKRADSPRKAIRRYCLSCSCGSRKEVRLCPSTHCSLHPFRLGPGAEEAEGIATH